MKIIGRGALTALGLLGALGAVGATGAVGCGGADATPGGASSGAAGDAGTVTIVGPDGGLIEVPPAPPPPPTVGKAVDGVFVSASKGIEGADGSRNRPVRTLAAAIALAVDKNKTLPVIACAETYAESLTLVDGVTMYGYFDCNADWKRVPERAKLVAPTSPGVLAEGMGLPTRFEGFDVTAPDMAGVAAAGVPATSSYGMIVRTSNQLSIAELTVRGGKGQDGADGVEPAGNVEQGGNGGAAASVQRACDLDIDGFGLCVSATHMANLPGGVSACKVGASGGPGGAGGNGPIYRNGVLQLPLTANEGRGRPGPITAAMNPATAVGGTMGFIGDQPGTNGISGNPGAAGGNAPSSFAFAGGGLVPANGTAGGVGLPGQGGGGGAGTINWYAVGVGMSPPPSNGTQLGAAGAGGGAGGCGGIAGTQGAGGGASIGLFVFDSQLVIGAGVRLEGKKGGRGGKGTLGTVGTPGGAGGIGAPTTSPLQGARGGNGGPGGAAGLSGHGAPGPSIALVHNGARPPAASPMDLVPGAPGDGAAALTRDAQTIPATVGIAKPEHAF